MVKETKWGTHSPESEDSCREGAPQELWPSVEELSHCQPEAQLAGTWGNKDPHLPLSLSSVFSGDSLHDVNVCPPYPLKGLSW